MMRSIRLRHSIAFLCLLLWAAALPCLGQRGAESSIRLDPFIGYEFGRLLTLERTPGAVIWCDECDGSGESFNQLFRFGATLHFPQSFLAGLDADARLSLSFSGGTFVSNPFPDPIIDPNTSEIILADRQFNVSSVVAAVGVDLLFGDDIGSGWQLRAGPWGEYRILSRFVHTEDIINPAGTVFFDNGTSTRIVAEGDMLGSFPLVAGLLFSISKFIPLADRLSIAPELYTRLDGTALSDGLGIRAFSGGIGIRFRLAEPNRPIALPPTLPQDLIPSSPPPTPHFALSANVDLYSINEAGERQQTGVVFPRTTLIRCHTPKKSERISHDYHAPQIGIAPEITANAGVRWWSLAIRQDGKEIVRVTSDDPSRSLDLDIRFEEGKDSSPLTAELLVEDSTGAVTGARDALPFIFDTSATLHRTGLKDYDVVEDWWNLEEEDNDFKEVNETNTTFIAEIVEAAYGQAETFVFPAHPSVKLSKEASKVAQLLGSQGVTPLLTDNIPAAIQEIAVETTADGVIVVVRRIR